MSEPALLSDPTSGRDFLGLQSWWRTRPERERLALIVLLLFAAVFAVYGRTTGFDFTNYDDPPYVTENPPVARRLSWAGVVWAFTTGHTGMWHPLTWLSHMLDVSLFGMNPTGHHLVNVGLHFLNVVLLFTFLRKTTHATGRSLVVALFFALHPLNVETVAWVSQRKSLLSAFFFLLTLLAWLEHVRGRRGAAMVAWILFACGLMAKPMVVTLPCVLLLLDFWPLRRTGLGWRRLILEKLPFFLLVAASAFMLMHPPGDVDMIAAPRVLSWHEAAFGLTNYFRYLSLLAWPWSLGALYPPVAAISFAAWLGGLAVLIIVTGLLAWRGRARPEPLVGWLWFLGMLVPVIGFIPMGGPHGIADRYAYLPAIGLFFGLVWSWRWPAVYGMWVAGVVALLWGGLGYRQAGYWRNSLSLWTHTAAITPASPTLLNNLGSALVAAGRDREAETCFLELEKLDPKEQRASLNLAVIYAREGRWPEALAAAERSVTLVPGDFRARSNYASLLTSCGRLEDAEQQLQTAIRQQADYADSWINLGIVRVEQKRLAEAVDCFGKAVAIRPDSEAARQNLALAREQLRQNQAIPGAGANREE